MNPPFRTIVVDDHQLFNEGISAVLRDSGYFDVVGKIFDSSQALRKIHDLKPDLVLIDYNMPKLSGLDLLRQVRQEKISTKVVIVSMYAEKKEIELFEKENIDGYFSKTISIDILIDSLIAVMQGKKIINAGNAPKDEQVIDSFNRRNQLSKREIDVLKYVKTGLKSEEIAGLMNLSIHTVITHRKNINQKLKFDNKLDFFEFIKNIE
jgi:DNA-binding NarL/FixJ family response regulator